MAKDKEKSTSKEPKMCIDCKHCERLNCQTVAKCRLNPPVATMDPAHKGFMYTRVQANAVGCSHWDK